MTSCEATEEFRIRGCQIATIREGNRLTGGIVGLILMKEGVQTMTLRVKNAIVRDADAKQALARFR